MRRNWERRENPGVAGEATGGFAICGSRWVKFFEMGREIVRDVSPNARNIQVLDFFLGKVAKAA